jgi:hypothetical protein
VVARRQKTLSRVFQMGSTISIKCKMSQNAITLKHHDILWQGNSSFMGHGEGGHTCRIAWSSWATIPQLRWLFCKLQMTDTTTRVSMWTGEKLSKVITRWKGLDILNRFPSSPAGHGWSLTTRRRRVAIWT